LLLAFGFWLLLLRFCISGHHWGRWCWCALAGRREHPREGLAPTGPRGPGGGWHLYTRHPGLRERGAASPVLLVRRSAQTSCSSSAGQALHPTRWPCARACF
jgi:hypothetical protein